MLDGLNRVGCDGLKAGAPRIVGRLERSGISHRVTLRTAESIFDDLRWHEVGFSAFCMLGGIFNLRILASNPTSQMLHHCFRGIDSMIFTRHAICGGERVGCVEGFQGCFRSAGGRAFGRDRIVAWTGFHSGEFVGNTDYLSRSSLRPVLYNLDTCSLITFDLECYCCFPRPCIWMLSAGFPVKRKASSDLTGKRKSLTKTDHRLDIVS